VLIYVDMLFSSAHRMLAFTNCGSYHLKSSSTDNCHLSFNYRRSRVKTVRNVWVLVCGVYEMVSASNQWQLMRQWRRQLVISSCW